MEEKASIANALREHVWPLLESGWIKIVVYKIFQFSEVAEAHRMMERGEHCGKIVLSFGVQSAHLTAVELVAEVLVDSKLDLPYGKSVRAWNHRRKRSLSVSYRRAARQSGVSAIHVAAFENETRPELADHADSIEWMRVGQLSRLLKYFEKAGVRQAIMAGQIAPKNLFDLRPDFRVLMMSEHVEKTKRRNLVWGLGRRIGESRNSTVAGNDLSGRFVGQ